MKDKTAQEIYDFYTQQVTKIQSDMEFVIEGSMNFRDTFLTTIFFKVMLLLFRYIMDMNLYGRR